MLRVPFGKQKVDIKPPTNPLQICLSSKYYQLNNKHMKIAVMGTGNVGQTLAGRLSGLGHEVMIGTRNAAETLARTTGDAYGGPPFFKWHEGNKQVKLGTFTEAAVFGEIVINATQGVNTINALDMAGEANLNGKVLIDISNPLDF